MTGGQIGAGDIPGQTRRRTTWIAIIRRGEDTFAHADLRYQILAAQFKVFRSCGGFSLTPELQRNRNPWGQAHYRTGLHQHPLRHHQYLFQFFTGPGRFVIFQRHGRYQRRRSTYDSGQDYSVFSSSGWISTTPYQALLSGLRPALYFAVFSHLCQEDAFSI